MYTEIISLGAISISLVSLFITYKDNQKNRKIAIITAERVKRYEDLQTICGSFCGYIARSIYDNKDEESFKQIFLDLYKIKLSLHYGFEKDKEVIDLAAELVESASQYKRSNSEKQREFLIKALEYFNAKCDIYLSAEWVRIKTESAPQKRTNEYNKWLKEYEVCERFNEANQQLKKCSFKK